MGGFLLQEKKMELYFRVIQAERFPTELMENCREFGSMLTRTGITMTTGGYINVVGKQVLNSLLDLHLRDSLLEFSFNSGPSGEYPVG